MAISKRELQNRAIDAVAAAYRHDRQKARDLIASAPQTWAYTDACDGLRADGFSVTGRCSDIIWQALGGNLADDSVRMIDATVPRSVRA